MSVYKGGKFRESDLQVQEVSVNTEDVLGLYLGDLRKLVEMAAELPDEAVITRTGGTTPSVSRSGEFYLFGLVVREETVA